MTLTEIANRNRKLLAIRALKVDKYIIALDVVVRHVVRVNSDETLQDLLENREVKRHVLMHLFLLLEAPVSEAARVPLHHDVVAAVIHTVIVQVCDTRFKTELLKTRDLSKDVVEDTAVVDCLRLVHLFDSDCLRL